MINFISNNLSVFIKGVAMGCSDLMPGISGGTIALILGVYKKLIHSINAISIKNFKTLTVDLFWKKINGNFLLSLFSGILSAVFTFSFIIDFLINTYPIFLWSFFLGILVTSIFILKKHVNQWSYLNIGLLILGSFISFFITQISPKSNDIGLIYLFFCGFIGIIAMILPGISGAYILLILGAYQTVLNLIKMAIKSSISFDINILIPIYTKLFIFGLGILIGLRVFSSILKWLLDNENDKTMSILIGLMIGAIHKIWPWQEVFKVTIGDQNKSFFRPISPLNYSEDAHLLWATILFLFGSGLVFILNSQKEKKNIIMGWFTPILLQNIILILKGVAMGAANKVPGVSGGIVAFVAGFYEELIDSLQKFNLKALSLLFKRQWYEFYVYVNGGFLTLLFSGVIISYFSISLILDYLIKYYEIQVLAVFFGMILASLYFVYHEIDKWKFKTILFFVIGLFIGLTIMLSKPLTENDGLFFVFFCGVISVSGMTLPGLSGSFLLLLLGNYTLLLVDSVNAIYYTLGDLIKMNLEFTNDKHRMKLLRLAVIFSLGSISGLIFFSNILSYVLKKYYQITIAIIIGFISGSLGVIWPWREKVFKLNEEGDIVNNSVGNPEIAYYDYLLPNIKTIDFWFLILFIILGAIVVTLLERYGVKKNK
ncbi:MAG: hypothetical protein CMC78_04995 [Flavobacteriaceae bacterium]|nr:hypothetical protein [Flavobacteriaceae bacterium]